MQLSDSFTVAAPVSKVWAILWDFPRLAASLPGCDQIEAVGDNAYKARMRQSVGPFKLELELALTVVESVSEERIVFTGSGADRQGNRLKIERASIELRPKAERQTHVSYVADFNLSGKLATLGYPVVKRKARDLGIEFGQRLQKIITGGKAHG